MLSTKSYWISAFFTIALATGFFMLFKNVLPKELFPEGENNADHIVVDEWMQEAIKEDSVAESIADSTHLSSEVILDKSNSDEKQLKTDTLLYIEKNIEDELEISPKEIANELEENIYLNYFYKSLFELQTQPEARKVRIAYFGDSMTDGDMIVQDLRKLFQSKYGGRGVGFVPITSESASSRGSITHKFSRNWEIYSYMKSYDTIYPYGVSGQVFYQKDTINATTLHLSSGLYAKGELLQNPELYYGKSKNFNGKVRVKTISDTFELNLEPIKSVNRLKLTQNSTKNLDLEFIEADSIPFYGVNLDLPYGVQIDNYSNRGNSGLPITQLNTQLMHAFQNALDYDLIILHYGTNVLGRGSYEYGWYQSRMTRVVDHLRNAFPNTSILVISIADKASKYETEMHTDSAVTHLLASQKAYANNKKTGFVNLFQLMGGDGSMIEWVEQQPERANKDYTHFNHRGAKEIAQMIYNQIDAGFDRYITEREEAEARKEYRRVQDSIQYAEKLKEQKIEEELRQKKDTTHVSED